MDIFPHLLISYAFFIFLAILFSLSYSFIDILLLLFFAILPDFDFFFFCLTEEGRKKKFFRHLFLYTFSTLPFCHYLVEKSKKRKEFIEATRHHRLPSHWPLIYLPLLFLLLFFPNTKLIVVCFGIYSHFILDTLSGGVRWFAPFSQKSFGL